MPLWHNYVEIFMATKTITISEGTDVHGIKLETTKKRRVILIAGVGPEVAVYRYDDKNALGYLEQTLHNHDGPVRITVDYEV